MWIHKQCIYPPLDESTHWQASNVCICLHAVLTKRCLLTCLVKNVKQANVCKVFFLQRTVSINLCVPALQISLEIEPFSCLESRCLSTAWRQPNELADICWGFLGITEISQDWSSRGLDAGSGCIVWDGWVKKRIRDGCKECHWCVCARTYAGRLKTAEFLALNEIDYNWGEGTKSPWRKHRRLIKDCGGTKNSRNKRIYLDFHLLVSHGKLA